MSQGLYLASHPLYPNPQAGVAALNFFGYINAFMIMLITIVWARVLHMRLRHALTFDPLTVFHETTEDMDTNEVTELPYYLTTTLPPYHLTTLPPYHLAYYLTT